jgi:hypothetical protein
MTRVILLNIFPKTNQKAPNPPPKTHFHCHTALSKHAQ